MATELLQIGDLNIAVYRHARRKRVALKVQNATFSLHLPKRYPIQKARQFVEAQQDWINQQLQQIPAPRDFAEYSHHPLLGVHYPLLFETGSTARPTLRWTEQAFILSHSQPVETEHIKACFRRFYRNYAQAFLTLRTQQLAQQTALQPSQLQVRSYRTRWGSCNARGEIRLNWQLIQAPRLVIDYVIIHELCHLQELNHSPRFWQLVSQHMADYPIHKAWLKNCQLLF